MEVFKECSKITRTYVWKSLWRANFSRRKLFGLLFLVSLVSDTLQKLLVPIALSWAVKTLEQLIKLKVVDSWQIVWQLVAYIAFFFVGQISSLVYGALHSHIKAKIAPLIRKELLGRIFKHSIQFHEDNKTGALTRAVDQVVSTYIALLDFVANHTSAVLVQFICAEVLLFFIVPVIAGTMLFWAIAYLGVVYFLAKIRSNIVLKLNKVERTMNGHANECITHARTVKYCNQEMEEEMEYERLCSIYESYTAQLAYYTLIATIGLRMLSVVVRSLVIWFSFQDMLHSRMDFATFLLLQTYLTQLIASLTSFGPNFIEAEQATTKATDSLSLLMQELAIKDPEPQDRLTLNDGKGQIEFRDVWFRYPTMEEGKWALQGLSMQINPGELVALVGISGGGKTTLPLVLQRLWEIQEGEILIDGQDIRKLYQADLRSKIRYAPQDIYLFNRALGVNLCYGCRGDKFGIPESLIATEQEGYTSRKEQAMVAAAKLACIHDHIISLPGGYDAIVGEKGVRLSGGQRQRVALARAFLQDGPILIIDEGTSNLDSWTELGIQRGLNQLREQGTTTLIVAHRLSTIKDADLIFVIDDGKILEKGNHEQLLALGGLYAKLWRIQSKQ